MSTLASLKLSNIEGPPKPVEPKPSSMRATPKTVRNMDKISKKLGGNLFNTPKPTDQMKEEIKVIRIIKGYYEKFPKLGSMSDEQLQALYKVKDPAILWEHVSKLQSEISAPYAEDMLAEIVFGVTAIAENVYMKTRERTGNQFNILGNIGGTAKYCREHRELFDEEIKELSILWEEWLTQGPLLRLITKIGKVGFMVNRMNSMGVAMENAPAQVDPKKVASYKDL